MFRNSHTWFAILGTLLPAWLFSYLIFTVWPNYGMAVFMALPFALGFIPVAVSGSKLELSHLKAIVLGLSTLGLYSIGLVLFAWEGLMCLLMAMPLAVPMCAVATLLARAYCHKNGPKQMVPLIVTLLMVPATAFMEKENGPIRSAVTTSVIINADATTVWNQVIEFPRMEDPTELLFKTGIAYPIDARIDGRGVGAVRYCNFSTGSFVEPITAWVEPELLAFSVLEQPIPMKEFGLTEIDAAHLHDYFVSERGQFKLTKLEDGRTELEGTTWYHHRIAPEFYWKPWSTWIIHRIHQRVLDHIKYNSESISPQ